MAIIFILVEYDVILMGVSCKQYTIGQLNI